MSRSRRTAGFAALGLTLAAGIGAAVTPTAAASSTCAKPPAMTFEAPTYIDEGRAGGEPIVTTLPDGTLLYGAHAGTTHFYSPAVGDATSAAFGQNYRGQTYYWHSDSDGKEWTFVDRTVPPSNVPGTGFSDPEFAYDTAGNVYVSEINLANVAMSVSTDGGKSYQLQNAGAMTVADRQWSEADEEGVVYLVGNVLGGGTFPGNPAGNSGHMIFKSTDFGKTFTNGFQDGDGVGDLRVDKRNGTLYEAYYTNPGGGDLSMAAYRDARTEDFKTPVEPEVSLIAEDVHMIGHWPAFDLDPAGNLYITWDENGGGERPAGVYYSWSTDEGRTWAKPVRLDQDEKTDIWPWLAVGDTGRVAVSWFQADVELPDQNAETAGDHGWRVVAAASLTGLGCGPNTTPGFSVSTATPNPVHTGTICQQGTTCQAQLVDRRLGDYFSIEIDGHGRMYAAYSDTQQGGSVSLPGFVRQKGGPSFLGGASEPRGVVKPAPKPAPKPEPAPKPAPKTAPLPATGMDMTLPLLGLLALGTGMYARRRRRA
jgi:LPXTG-motif cell wall-anchored protein